MWTANRREGMTNIIQGYQEKLRLGQVEGEDEEGMLGIWQHVIWKEEVRNKLVTYREL